MQQQQYRDYLTDMFDAVYGNGSASTTENNYLPYQNRSVTDTDPQMGTWAAYSGMGLSNQFQAEQKKIQPATSVAQPQQQFTMGDSWAAQQPVQAPMQMSAPTQIGQQAPSEGMNIGSLFGQKQSGQGEQQWGAQGIGYATMAANAIGGITSSFLDTSNKLPESQALSGTMDTVMSNIPVVGQYYQLGNAINQPLKDWQSDAIGRGANDEAHAAATMSGMVDPMDGWSQNAQAYESGVISEGEAVGNMIAQFFLPGYANNAVMDAYAKKKAATDKSNAQRSTPNSIYGGGRNYTSPKPKQMPVGYGMS